MNSTGRDQATLFDLHGEALLDYWKGDTGATTILEFSDGSVREIPAAVYFRTPEAFYPVERMALPHASGRVLVVGAGAGVHALPLQEQGLEVHALEISDAAVKLMRMRGLSNAHLGDFFQHRGSYDTILLLGRNIGIAGTVEGLPGLLGKCAELLAPNGSVITNSISEAVSPAPEEGRGGRVDGSYVGELLFRTVYKGRKSGWIRWLHVDYRTLSAVAEAAGWTMDPILVEDSGEFSATLRHE